MITIYCFILPAALVIAALMQWARDRLYTLFDDAPQASPPVARPPTRHWRNEVEVKQERPITIDKSRDE